MILSELKSYLKTRGRAPILDLARKLEADPDAIRGMLEIYVRKGQVRRLDAGGACGGCVSCDPMLLEIYEWTGDGAGAGAAGSVSSCTTGANPLLR